MRVAIMQPYFCPYLGYFQLMKSVEQFVLLDDVNFITRGWINRNQVLLNGSAHMITLPVAKASQNERICDLSLSTDSAWQERLLKTIYQAYRRAPQFSTTFRLAEALFRFDDTNLAVFVGHSVRLMSQHLRLRCEILQSSDLMPNPSLRGQDRIIHLCKELGATEYINPPGGKSLYRASDFLETGIKLYFLEPALHPYLQFEHAFVSGLSVIDALMFNTPSQVNEALLSGHVVSRAANP
jgi:hypothetical protein